MHATPSSLINSPLDFVSDRVWRFLLVGSFGLAVVCGTIGNWQYQDHAEPLQPLAEPRQQQAELPQHQAAPPHPPATRAPLEWLGVFGNALYHTAQLFLLHSPHYEKPVPWTLELSRWLAAATSLSVVVGVGAHFLREERSRQRLRTLSDHAIVCGLGARGMSIVRHLRREGQPVVVIDKTPPPESAHECGLLRVPLVLADAAAKASLREARIAHARLLYAVCPDDATNCEIAANARSLRQVEAQKKSARPATGLTCHVHLSDVDLREVLQSALSDDKGELPAVRCFDIYDREARELLVTRLPIDHDGIQASDPRQAHLVILGFGRMGRMLAVRAAQLGVFANFSNQPRLKLSVIDRKADTHRDALLFRHPRIADVCELEFHNLEIASVEAWRLLEKWCGDRERLTSIVACFNDETRAIELGLRLRPLLQNDSVRFTMRLRERSGVANLLRSSQGQTAPLGERAIFDLETDWPSYLDDDKDPFEQFARTVHARYEELLAAKDGKPPPADQTHAQTWRQQLEDFRESCREQAAHIFIKLRAIGMEAVPESDPRPAVMEMPADQIEALSRLEHARWMTERLVANWEYHDGPKDRVNRKNPNLVDWEKLTDEVKEYDRVFVRAIPQLLEAAGYKAVRRRAK